MFDAPMLGREAARYWWIPLVAGIAWLLVGWIVLRADITSLVAVGVLMGVLFLGVAVNEAVMAAAVTGGWKILHYVLAGVFVLAGLWAFFRPIDTFFALASVLGLILILQGTFEIIRAIATRDESRYWWIGLVTGILLLLLAFWVSSSDRVFALAQRAYLILFWVGFMALIRGFSQIFLAFTLRRARTAPEAAPGVAPGTVTGAVPGAAPGTVPGAAPETVPGAAPGTVTGAAPGTVTGAAPGTVTGGAVPGTPTGTAARPDLTG